MKNEVITLRIHNLLKRTKVLGPGERYAVWLQGCDKCCPYCMTPSSRDKNGGFLMKISDLVQLILAEQGLEGITVSGGEPFLQSKALYLFLKEIREKSSLGIIIYTGFYMKELREKHVAEIDEIINLYSDIIIEGPYIDELNDGKSLRGSSNQTINLTSDRYKNIIDSVYDQPDRKAEIHLNGEEALLVGIPDEKSYEMWKNVFLKEK